MRLAEDLRAAVLQAAFSGNMTERKSTDRSAKLLINEISRDTGCEERQAFLDAPFLIPEEWVWASFSTLCKKLSTGPFGTMLHKSDYVVGGVPIVNPMHMKNGKIVSTENMRVSHETATRLESYTLHKGDIVLARRGELGRLAVVTEKEEGWICGTGSFFVTPTKHINLEYLLRYFSSPTTKTLLLGDSIGTTMDNLNQKNLGNLPVPLPPIEEQQRIVDRINELMQMIDEYEQMENQLIELKAQFPGDLRDAVLVYALQGKLTSRDKRDEPVTLMIDRLREKRESAVKSNKKMKLPEHEPFFEIPEEWTWTTLSKIGTLSGGKTPSMQDASYWSSEDVNWFTSKDMKKRYLEDSEKKISYKGAEELQQYAPGTLLIVVRSGILKHTLPVCITKKEGTINQDLKAFTLFDNRMSDYVFWMLKALQTNVIQNYTKHVTTVDSLRLDEFFYQMPVPLPPIEEQQRIVERLEAIIPLCDALAEEM